MSSSDSRQTRYANTNANARRPGNWGSDPAREYRPIGQRYGSVLVLSGPKRKQSGPTVRKPVPRPVNLPSQRKDRQAEGSLLSSKQTRTEDSTQSENTAQSLNSHTWHNSSGTWTSPQDNSHRTDEYGFPIRSEAPINAREFPSLAASKQAPAGKKTSQQDQADAYFSLDDRDTLPPADSDTFKAFGSRRDDRAESHQDWRSGRGESGSRDEELEGVRAFPGGRNQESRRGAFGFNNTEVERRAGSGSAGFRSRSGGGNAFGSRVGSRLEDYGMRPGSSPGADKGSPGPRPGDDYVGPAAQILGASNTIITSTLLGSGIAGVTVATQGEDEEDEEEDEELQRHYKELEAIKQEEEEKNRQRVIAAEASSVDGGCEEGEEGDTWEDAAASDDLVDNAKSGDDAMGLKPIDHEKWQQRQAELEEEDRQRRERAEAKKRELEEAITRREEMKQRAAREAGREASEAALAALTAANAPIPLQQQPQIVPPPPPPPPRVQGSPADIPVHAPTVYDNFQAFSADNAMPRQDGAPRRSEVVPAPAPAQPAWTQSLYAREPPKAAVDIVVPPPPPPPRAESSQSTTKSAQQDGWQDEWRSDGGQSHVGREAGHRIQRDSGREPRGEGRGRGRRGDGAARIADGKGGRSRASTSALTTPGSNTPQASSRCDGQHGDTGSTTASATPSDADAAAVAAAAKVAKAMEGYALSLPTVLPSKGASKDGAGKQVATNGVEELASSTSPPLATPPAAQDDSGMYSSYGGGAALMPASDAVHTLERMDKQASMFDGKEDGEDLLPSNIFGGDDALYSGSTGKSASTGVVPTRPSPLLPMHDAGFGPPLPAAQSKSVAGSVHVSRAFSSPDHPSALPLGSPATFGAPSQPHQSVRDRLPDEVPLWGRSHDWAPPPPPTTLHHSTDLHLHTAPFHPGDVSTYMPSTAPTQQAATSNPPPSFNAFGYPSSTYSGFGMQQQSYSLNAVFQQPTQPLLPTSKPPDWSNNAPSGIGWPSVAPPVAGHNNNVHPVMTPENQAFAMRSAASHSSFPPNGAAPQAPSIPVRSVSHPHQRRVEVEMKLPDTLGLSAGPAVSKVPLTSAASATPAPPPGNSNSRSGRGNRGNRGGNSSGPPPPPPRSSGGRGDGSQSRSRGSDTDRQGQNQSAGSGGSRRQGLRGGRGRGQGRRGRERAEPGPAPSANAV